jgi:hypothetical protein
MPLFLKLEMKCRCWISEEVGASLAGATTSGKNRGDFNALLTIAMFMHIRKIKVLLTST